MQSYVIKSDPVIKHIQPYYHGILFTKMRRRSVTDTKAAVICNLCLFIYGSFLTHLK